MRPEDFLEKPHAMSSIKKVIGVVSGKGGVGKSLVTSLMAVEMNRRGAHAAILDADVTGPSIPCLLYTSPSPRDYAASRMPSSA